MSVFRAWIGSWIRAIENFKQNFLKILTASIPDNECYSCGVANFLGFRCPLKNLKNPNIIFLCTKEANTYDQYILTRFGSKVIPI